MARGLQVSESDAQHTRTRDRELRNEKRKKTVKKKEFGERRALSAGSSCSRREAHVSDVIPPR